MDNRRQDIVTQMDFLYTDMSRSLLLDGGDLDMIILLGNAQFGSKNGVCGCSSGILLTYRFRSRDLYLVK